MKKSMRSGFTLIELMVVVVLVMILALAIVPTFKEIIVKAKYTEGASAISALRTKIKVFFVENERLPGLTDGEITAADTALDADPTTVVQTALQSLCSKATAEEWVIDPASGATATGDTDLSTVADDLDIQAGDYAGAYLKDTDYSYIAFHSGYRSDSYGYVILAAGSGERKSPPVGTGYAVMEIRNAGWDEKQLSTFVFERYKAMSDRTNTGMPLYLSNNNGVGGQTSEDPDTVGYVADWATEMTSLTSAATGGPDGDAFKAAGWTMQ